MLELASLSLDTFPLLFLELDYSNRPDTTRYPAL